jgi:hypothetical protein
MSRNRNRPRRQSTSEHTKGWYAFPVRICPSRKRVSFPDDGLRELGRQAVVETGLARTVRASETKH